MTKFPHGIFATPNIGGGAGRVIDMFNSNNIFFVDYDNGSDSNSGKSPTSCTKLISQAVTNAAQNASIYVKPRTSASTQLYHIDNITIPLTKPNLSIVGAGNPGTNCGVQMKPLAVGSNLIDVLGAGATIENMRLTLTGGTADVGKCIIHAQGAPATGSATSVPDGLQVRGCIFTNDKSHPGISTTDVTASLGLGSLSNCIIENNTFQGCLGGIAMQSVRGGQYNIRIMGNYFQGPVANRVCDVILSINDNATTHGLVFLHNVFADGKPAHGAGEQLFISMPYLTAGTGIIAGNYFATATATGGFKEAGSLGTIADNMFFAGNWIEGAGTTDPMNQATRAA